MPLNQKVLTFTPNNEVDQILAYEVFKSAARDFDFRIVNVQGTKPATVHNYPFVDMRAIRADLQAKGLATAAIDDFVTRFLTR